MARVGHEYSDDFGREILERLSVVGDDDGSTALDCGRYEVVAIGGEAANRDKSRAAGNLTGIVRDGGNFGVDVALNLGVGQLGKQFFK